MLNQPQRAPKKIRKRILEALGGADPRTVVYAPTKAGVSAAIFDLVPWVRRVTVSEAGIGAVTLAVDLPWWSRLTLGFLRRRAEGKIRAAFADILPLGVRVDLRVR